MVSSKRLVVGSLPGLDVFVSTRHLVLLVLHYIVISFCRASIHSLFRLLDRGSLRWRVVSDY